VNMGFVVSLVLVILAVLACSSRYRLSAITPSGSRSAPTSCSRAVTGDFDVMS